MKTFSKMTDDELVWWFIYFLNGGDWDNPEDRAKYEQACDEVDKRSEEVQNKVAYAHQVI